MQFSESWLRQYVNPKLSSEELGRALTMAGLEVEDQHPLAPPFTNVVVAEILSAEQHPDADRLRVCRVNAGTGRENLQIVCGAPNARVGIKIPCALVGAELPPSEAGGKPFQIKVGKLRGVESNGMLCSGRELGLGEDHAGIYELPNDAPVGKDIRDYLHLDDSIFTIKLTPNKADCLSVWGVAREVSAITNTPLSKPPLKPITSSIQDQLSVKIEAPDLCGRFAGRVIKGVNAKAKTPQWIIERLKSAGQRSISPLVDLSNYVMLEMGQPSHVFDLDRIQGGLQVRWGKSDESLTLLNDQTVELSPSATDFRIGVIADHQGPLSLAGVMGGSSSAVSDATQNIYVEAAFWWPQAIQGRARRFNFTTDAGHRFERGVDPHATAACLDYLCALIVEVCGGQVGPLHDQVISLPERKPVAMRLARAVKVIGIPLSVEQVSTIFKRLGFVFQVSGSASDAIFTIEPPSYRFDIEIEADLIEEVARLYGFENIPDLPPTARLEIKLAPEAERSIHTLRHRLAQEAYQEVINFGFTDSQIEMSLGVTQSIEVLNPIANQFNVMRSNLWGGLLQNLRSNLNRGINRVRLFEVGRVFERNPQIQDGPGVLAGFEQPRHIGGLAYGFAQPEQWGSAQRNTDFFDVKGELERVLYPLMVMTTAVDSKTPQNCPKALHPGRSAVIYLHPKVGQQPIAIGFLGELHPALQQRYELTFAPILFEIDWDLVKSIGLPTPKEISKFPLVQRDLALVVKQSLPAQSVLDSMLGAKQNWVQKIELFDEFRPNPDSKSATLAADEKSLAFRVSLVSELETLQDAQVDSIVAALLSRAEKECGARLR
jgi:phenylalanyl-tRNA synthetase beta chain